MERQLDASPNKSLSQWLRLGWTANGKLSRRSTRILLIVGKGLDRVSAMDQLYVELQVGGTVSTAADFPKHHHAEGQADFLDEYLIEDLISLDPERFPWVTRRWIIQGDPGSGKTTLLRHLAAKVATEGGQSWIPVFEWLPRLLGRKGDFLRQAEERLGRAIPLLGLAEELDRQGRSGRLLLLLDGLDEVPRSQREDAKFFLKGVHQRWPKATIIVTSRPIGYVSPHLSFREVRVLPLGRQRLKQFLKLWLTMDPGVSDLEADQNAEQLLCEWESGDGQLMDLARIPLYLTLMALLVNEKKSLEHSLPRLYAQVFELLLDGRHHLEIGEPIPRNR